VVQSKKSFAKAAKLQTLHPHDSAAEPACQHFGPCGGCSLQALQYPAQLAAKQCQVADLLRRTAGVADVEAVLRPIVGCQPGAGAAGQPYGYRNKMEFSFSAEAWQPPPMPQQEQHAASGESKTKSSSSGGSSSFALGLHRPGSSTEVLPISRCHLQPDGANQLLQRVLLLCQQAGLQPHDPISGSGLLQHVVIRRGTPTSGSGTSAGSSSSGEVGSSTSNSRGSAGSAVAAREEYLLNFVTASDGRQALAPLARVLMRQQQQQPAAGQPTAAQHGAPAAAAAAAAAAAPAVVGVVNSVSQRGRPTGERRLAAEHVLEGRGWLTEQLCGLEFEVRQGGWEQLWERCQTTALSDNSLHTLASLAKSQSKPLICASA
jgi:hypothetical protein